MIAALFVLKDGPYSKYPGIVDPWPEERDARLYAGPHPAISHSPCKRWGRYAAGGPSAKRVYRVGDDDGCFEAGLKAVKRFGGVLEHPEASIAFWVHNIERPRKWIGWQPAGLWHPGCWVCSVEQGHYGHPSRKATWLFVSGVDRRDLPELKWEDCASKARLDEGFHSAEERRRRQRSGTLHRLSRRQQMLTPQPFAEILISIAQSARRVA